MPGSAACSVTQQLPPMISREAMSRAAMTSSFTALAFAPGVLNTGTPISASSSSGMLFTPTPARPTASTVSGSAMPCMSAERTMIARGDGASSIR